MGGWREVEMLMGMAEGNKSDEESDPMISSICVLLEVGLGF